MLLREGCVFQEIRYSIIIVQMDYYYTNNKQMVLLLKKIFCMHLLFCTGLFRHVNI